MTLQLPPLPKVLRVACDAGGMEAVLSLSEALGGRRIKVPSKEGCGDNHPLVVAAGRSAAHAICAEWRGEMLEIPIGGSALNLWLASTLVAEGRSLNEIARTLRISFRYARRLRKKVLNGGPVAPARQPRKKGDPRQLDIEDITGKPGA